MNEQKQPDTPIKPVTSLAHLVHLPAFAAYLRDRCLEDFIDMQIQYAKAVSLSLLQELSHLPAEQLRQVVKQYSVEHLNFLAANKAAEQIEDSIRKWRTNQLPNIDQNAIGNYDITLFTHVRKQAMLQFAPRFCGSMQQMLELMQELDFYAMKSEDASFETYLDLLRNKIEEQSYLTTKITNTSPGIIYLLNLKPYSVLFANQTGEEFFGISNEEFLTLGPHIFEQIIHPDDIPATLAFADTIYQAKDAAVSVLELRMKPKEGGYKWMRNYVSVFRRNADGTPSQLIGNMLSIQAEKETSQKLVESQTLYKQAQALARLGNWTLNLQTGEASWSDEMFRIYEVPVQAMLNMEEWKRQLGPAYSTEVLDHIQYCIDHQQPYDKVHRIVLRNGSEKTVHRKAEIVYNDAGKAVYVVGTTQDVTEQHRVQQELKENQTFLHKITNAAPSIIASYNINTGRYVFVSDGLHTLLGYQPSLLLAEGNAFFKKLIHPEDFDRLMQTKRDTLSASAPPPGSHENIIELRYRMLHASGHWRWFHTYATVFDRNAQGGVEHVLNITTDVTEQEEASQKIQAQEHFIQNIADASPTILYVYDVAGANFAYVNREIYFVLGYTPEEIAAMGDAVTEQLYHPEDYALLPERRQSERRIVQSDTMIQYECRLRARSGEWHWFLVREVVFITDEKERPLQIVGAALDITKRKEMEKTLLQNSFLLEQSNASLEEFAYVASHDLKEPLRKISTFGDRLAATQEATLTPEGKLYLSKIIDASQRMQTMISDLLSISLISGDKSYEKYSLQKVLEETVQTLEAKIEQKAAQVEWDGLPEAQIVVSQFRQLFQNLISNSLKFVADGVQPQVHISHAYLQPADVAGFQLSPASRYLKIDFRDNGIGFENEFAGKIFLVFQRLHGRSEYEGSGIGLAICKKIAEHHGGIIYASGIPGEGATFTIIIPLERNE